MRVCVCVFLCACVPKGLFPLIPTIIFSLVFVYMTLMTMCAVKCSFPGTCYLLIRCLGAWSLNISCRCEILIPPLKNTDKPILEATANSHTMQRNTKVKKGEEKKRVLLQRTSAKSSCNGSTCSTDHTSPSPSSFATKKKGISKQINQTQKRCSHMPLIKYNCKWQWPSIFCVQSCKKTRVHVRGNLSNWSRRGWGRRALSFASAVPQNAVSKLSFRWRTLAW